MTAQPDLTQLLVAWGEGDQAAFDTLAPLVYNELRRMARRYMVGERVGHTLQATALVNEVYIRLLDVNHLTWRSRAHFFGMSARLMRRILVDFARSKHYQKRGGNRQQVSLDDALLVSDPGRDLVALDDALEALAQVDGRKSQVVEMRYFGGLTVAETAEALKISPETVMRDWKLAKSWLLRELAGAETVDTKAPTRKDPK